MNLLWLASWFPNRLNTTAGDFIYRQAMAVAPFVKHLTIIAVFKDDTMAANAVEIESKKIDNILIYTAYYGKNYWGGVVGKILSQKKYISIQQQLFNEVKNQIGLPDLVHVHVAMKAGIFARQLKRKLGIPFIVTEHWSGYNKVSKPNIYNMGRLFLQMNKAVLKAAAILLPVSENLAKTITQNFVLVPYKVIPNVVDTNLFFHVPNNAPVFRFIHPSYMNYPKNPTGILKACKLLKQSGYQFELQMIGSKNKSLQLLAYELGILNESVFFEGEIPYASVAQRMQQSSALLMFSKYENLPCIMLEALCCGLPVVSSRVGGIPEVINDTNGILVEKDNITELVAAMKSVIDNYSIFNRPLIASEAAKTFSYQLVGKSIFETYKVVVSTHTKC